MRLIAELHWSKLQCLGESRRTNPEGSLDPLNLGATWPVKYRPVKTEQSVKFSARQAKSALMATIADDKSRAYFSLLEHLGAALQVQGRVKGANCSRSSGSRASSFWSGLVLIELRRLSGRALDGTGSAIGGRESASRSPFCNCRKGAIAGKSLFPAPTHWPLVKPPRQLPRLSTPTSVVHK